MTAASLYALFQVSAVRAAIRFLEFILDGNTLHEGDVSNEEGIKHQTVSHGSGQQSRIRRHAIAVYSLGQFSIFNGVNCSASRILKR